MQNGKGSKSRSGYNKIYRDNFDQIDWCRNAYIDKKPLEDTEDLITDGYQYWTRKCCMCGENTMEIIRIGKVQCSQCG